MLPYFSVAKRLKVAANPIVVWSGFVLLTFLVIVGFGPLIRTQGEANTLHTRHVSSTPTKIQPKMTPNYGKLPLSFEANQGQTGGAVRFLARGGGYTIFLTDDEAVLTLRRLSDARVAPIGTRRDIVGKSARKRVAQHPPFRAAVFPNSWPLLMRNETSGSEVEQPQDWRAGPALPSTSRRAATGGVPRCSACT